MPAGLARRLHDRQLRIGFNYAWRFDPRADAAFWHTLGRQGGAALRRATDWVGVDIYPGTYVPSQPEVVHLGDALLEGLGTVNAYRGTYDITDLHWFDLRDNNSPATGVESHFGLLRDDYSPKPAFALYRRLIARWGAPAPR